MGRPNTSGGSPTTPSRDFGRSGERPVRPSLSLSGGRKRKSSARSFSVSGLTGVYTPDTMMRQDPFFFAELQALPDDLKIAAFTPLPTEDDDEYLEGIDNELKTQASTFPTALPAITTTGIRKHGSASFSGPSSAPAAGFMRPSFGTPPAVRSPLLEPSQSILGRLEDHLEEEERPSAQASPAASSTPLPEVSAIAEGSTDPSSGSKVVQHEFNVATSDPLGQSIQKSPATGLGLDITAQTPSIASGSNEPPPKETTAHRKNTENHPLAVPTPPQATSRPVSPALPPKHESLQARLARLAKSRATGTVTDSSQAQKPRPETPAIASPISPQSGTSDAMQTLSTSTSALADQNPASSTPDNTVIVKSVGQIPVKLTHLEKLLRQYAGITNLDDTTAIEAFLKQRPLGSSSEEQGSAKNGELPRLSTCMEEYLLDFD